MTPRTMILILVTSVIALGAIGVSIYYVGEQRGETRAKIAALQAHEEEQHELELVKQASADSLRQERARRLAISDSLDSLRHARAAAAAKALTTASVTRAMATLDSGSVTITTDSGPATYTVPQPVAHQWALERAADAAAMGALSGQVAADSEAIASRDGIIALDAQRDSVRDEVDAALRAQLADANAANKLLQKETKPRFTFTEGAVAGALGAVAVKLAIAALF